ncbi:MAG: hypothetical protein ACLUJG_08660 [Lawsonibacter sp.]
MTSASPASPAGRRSGRRRDTMEFIVKTAISCCAASSRSGCVLSICVYLIIAGLPAIL